MNFIKLLLVALFVSASLQSAQQVNVLVAPQRTNIISGAVQITEIEVVNNEPSLSAIVNFYDAPSSNITWTNTAFTSYLVYTTNLITYSTNYFGTITTNTNSVAYNIPSTTSAASRNYHFLKSVTVAAGGSYTWAPIGGVYTSYGLTLTNSATNVTINTTYSNITR